MEKSSYQIVNGFGEGVDNASIEQMQEFLRTLDIVDEEHGEVWLTHDQTSWTLSCFPDSKVVFYRISDEYEYNPRHLIKVSCDKMLELWQKLANGQFEDLEKEAWKSGN